jgi:hypothetical protein
LQPCQDRHRLPSAHSFTSHLVAGGSVFPGRSLGICQMPYKWLPSCSAVGAVLHAKRCPAGPAQWLQASIFWPAHIGVVQPPFHSPGAACPTHLCAQASPSVITALWRWPVAVALLGKVFTPCGLAWAGVVGTAVQCLFLRRLPACLCTGFQHREPDMGCCIQLVC